MLITLKTFTTVEHQNPIIDSYLIDFISQDLNLSVNYNNEKDIDIWGYYGLVFPKGIFHFNLLFQKEFES